MDETAFQVSSILAPTKPMTSDTDIRRARALARVLDSAVGIPGTSLRVGLDAILGLIPGGGDVAGAALSGYIVLTAARLGAPKPVLARMLVNVLVDTAIGTVPVLGDLFDVAYKSNLLNVELLERYAADPVAVRRQSRWVAAGVVVIIVAIAAAVGTLGVLLVRALWNLATT